ncbi:hypothetical protein [Haloprofundus halophilus]|uniref:hypothetical protein n=1 Tax=Haloprofundus halophilus TaxID=2283527 RepID=UPI000E43C15F|nr:hypothetical protein [Haloprofundus halophilus]
MGENDKTLEKYHYYQPADAIIVYNERDLNHYQPLNGRPLTHWHQYVAKKRGWKSMDQLAHAGLQIDAQQKETQA